MLTTRFNEYVNLSLTYRMLVLVLVYKAIIYFVRDKSIVKGKRDLFSIKMGEKNFFCTFPFIVYNVIANTPDLHFLASCILPLYVRIVIPTTIKKMLGFYFLGLIM